MDEEAAIGKLVPSQYPKLGPIDPERARFPCCIVWSPLPLISWLIPCIGHIGICREDGIILDFAGPNFVCVDNFAFGAATRYIQVNREKCNVAPSSTSNVSSEAASEKIMTWDEALRKGTQEFQHRAYSLFTCNCHSFVANNLNRMSYCGRQNWNVVNLAALLFLKGAWVSKCAIVKTLLPFLVFFGVGLTFGGSTFLIMLAVFVLVLVGWFLIGTYCFKGLILL